MWVGYDTKFPDEKKNMHVDECQAMIEENRQLVTNEPVEFEEKQVEVQDCRKITDHF